MFAGSSQTVWSNGISRPWRWVQRADGNVPLQFFSEDAAANEEWEKIIKEFYRRVRFSSNDRSVPASDEQ